MSLRARIAERETPRTEYRLRIRQTAGPEAELRRTQEELFRDPGAPDARDAVDAARRALDACYEVLVIEALAPNDFEDLLAKHQPTPEQRKENPDASFNPATFRPALMEACVQGDMTADDWADFLVKPGSSLGEVNDLWWTVWGINGRAPDPSVPLGSTGTRS